MIALAQLKPVLKRGVLLTAANWPLVIVQFIATAVFRMLLAVPILGGILLVSLLGGDIEHLLATGLRESVTAIATELLETPLALVWFLAAVGVVLLGGSAVLFLVKGGTVTVLAASEWAAGAVERPPLRWQAIARAGRFSVDRFVGGCAYLFRRYLRLGLSLVGVYAVTGVIYLAFVLGAYRLPPPALLPGGWPVATAIVSAALLVWITLVNSAYLLVQMVIAVEDVGVGAGVVQAARFVRDAFAEVAGIFTLVLLLVLAATAVAVLAAAGFALIAFLPFPGIILLPLQAVAWLLRGLLFEFIGLAALGAYLSRYRAYSGRAVPALPAGVRIA